MQKRPPVIAQLQFEKHKDKLQQLSLQDRFSAIYQMNLWDAGNTRSGVGSERSATMQLEKHLPLLLKDYNIQTLIDAPCGDTNWISHINLPLKKYIGLDIVPELINSLNVNYSQDGQKEFHLVDLTQGPVPAGDMILCRDCLVHLSYDNIEKTVSQFKASKNKWLLVTHFTEITDNIDIVDGDWRPLNFTIPPFNWPSPSRVINEECLEMDGAYADKSLGLWQLVDLL